MKIGVFDSGVGGENVVEAIKTAIPDAMIIFKDDRKNLPYGNKTPEQMLAFVSPIIQEFEQEKVEAIVIACNTVSTNILVDLQASTHLPIVGFVPMVKPACAQTKTKNIMVCATSGTLQSSRYKQLKRLYAKGVSVHEPDCSDWASLIEGNDMDETRVAHVISQAKENNIDVLVLGCTHYHWIYDLLDNLSGPDIAVIQPTSHVITELKRAISH